MAIRLHNVCTVALLCAAPLLGHAGELGTLYTQVGTNGIGIGYAQSVGENWALRGQYNALPKTSFSGDVGDFGATAKLIVDIHWSSVQLLADWYPGAGGFRLTGGAVLNNNKITISGNGKVNDKDAAVNAEIKMSDTLAPYLGIGYGSRPKTSKGFGFNYDLGVMLQNPKSTLTATGADVSQSDIDTQNRKVQDAIDNMKVMPVFGIGVSYAF